MKAGYVRRFSKTERAIHWANALGFFFLLATGLILYLPSLSVLVGRRQLFQSLHFWAGVGWLAALAAVLVLGVRRFLRTARELESFDRDDLRWLRGRKAPQGRFNAGQKILFWGIMLCGLSISLSGLELMFPFKFSLFAKTFGMLGGLGFGVPGNVTGIQEMQFASAWHAIMALVLVCVIFAHIYIGTLGMEGAFDAMATGHVDENWAKEHHSLWAARAIAERDAAETHAPKRGGMQPAE